MSASESFFFNRELSWLAFNERVLDEAARPDLPALERLKFLAITAANLDEFFMVRVGALQWQRQQGRRATDAAGLTPTQLWDLVHERTSAFLVRQHTLLQEVLIPSLAEHGIRRLTLAEITQSQRTRLEAHFLEHLFPVLSPIALDLEAPQPLPALRLLILVKVQPDAESDARLVLLALPGNLSRQINVPDAEGLSYAYLNLEDVVTEFLPHFFPSEKVLAHARFRITRNTDISADDENAVDLASEMEGVLDKRLQSPSIRVEIESGAPRDLTVIIRQLAQARQAQVYLSPGELDLSAYFTLASITGFEALKVEPWPSHEPAEIEPGESLFDTLKRGDLLLHHPYQSFEPVVKWIEEAAADPNVIAIKQILYRTAKNSRIVTALVKAAEAGKQVTVLVELKARFDEARNLDRASDLLNAGAQIIYGVRSLKTHAKVCLILRRESGHLRRYMHFGTGNYNEATAKLYTDISYLTCRESYGCDASAFFNTVTGRSRFGRFQKLSMAPFGLRERLLSLIRSETDRAQQGEAAEMLLKMNSLEDREMIEALYEASKAGVKISLNVRGICCLRPGVKGLSENIRVISIIDRYLEHARIYFFRQGGQQDIFISSADFMTRNLSKRVELLIPVEDKKAKKRLLHILQTHFADTSRARQLHADGQWTAPQVPVKKALRSQAELTKHYAKLSQQHQQAPDLLVPHFPKAAE
jgi:polyphosphate kinase